MTPVNRRPRLTLIIVGNAIRLASEGRIGRCSWLMRDVCSLIWLALIGLFRSRASLQAEILTLRHQLNVLRRKSPQRLTFDAHVKAADFVIIPAASSSVSMAAIQITNYAGATPIALTRTSEKKTRLHEAGAAHVIATQEQDMVAEVMRITNGNGARIAFDPVGGPDFPKLISALTNQGIAYIYGALSEGDTAIPVLEMIRRMPTVKGYSIRLVTGDEARRKVAVEYVVKGLASGALKPVIDRTFKFDDMVEVHRYLEHSGQFGKIVVTL